MMAIDQLRQNGKRLGKTSAELGWILEDNKATNNIIRSVGGVHYKTHRLYEKALVNGPTSRVRRPRRPSLRSPTAPSWRCGSPTCCPTSAAGWRRRGRPGR